MRTVVSIIMASQTCILFGGRWLGAQPLLIGLVGSGGLVLVEPIDPVVGFLACPFGVCPDSRYVVVAHRFLPVVPPSATARMAAFLARLPAWYAASDFGFWARVVLTPPSGTLKYTHQAKPCAAV